MLSIRNLKTFFRSNLYEYEIRSLYANPRAFKNFQIPVNYEASKSAWMSSKNFKASFHGSFVRNIQQILKKQKFTTNCFTSGR